MAIFSKILAKSAKIDRNDHFPVTICYWALLNVYFLAIIAFYGNRLTRGNFFYFLIFSIHNLFGVICLPEHASSLQLSLFELQVIRLLPNAATGGNGGSWRHFHFARVERVNSTEMDVDRAIEMDVSGYDPALASLRRSTQRRGRWRWTMMREGGCCDRCGLERQWRRLRRRWKGEEMEGQAVVMKEVK
ncbi:hypothetical protein C8R45DRAFT_923484 [Mycena sanguinolenta]|nr:hypothetical protein C8R45DRAFT_923484 [Mycena sanguinolenta]